MEDVVKGYTGAGNILICWEHDALSDIVDELGKDDNPPTYPDDAYVSAIRKMQNAKAIEAMLTRAQIQYYLD